MRPDVFRILVGSSVSRDESTVQRPTVQIYHHFFAFASPLARRDTANQEVNQVFSVFVPGIYLWGYKYNVQPYKKRYCSKKTKPMQSS